MTAELYRQVVTVAEDYLGPAAPRFVARQVAFLFNKNPQELALEDMPRLIEWTRVTLALLTDDQQVVEECARKLGELTKAKP